MDQQKIDYTTKWETFEEISSHDGFVYNPDTELFFRNLEEAEHYYHGMPNVPEFLQVCEPSLPPDLELDGAIESMCDEMFEDARNQLKGLDELQAAVDEFNKKNKSLQSWFPTDKKIRLKVST